ncbi:MAG TPA: hypothetical protein VHZ07_17505 [Bryobacteraceae bacterium]|jgi:hypothetical protein|nr:hypothetical protein [Bryobacteraceae bacterium]
MTAKTNITTISLLALIILDVAYGANEIIFSHRYGQFRTEALVSGAATSVSSVEELYRSRMGTADRVELLRVFRSPKDSRVLSGKGHTDNDYASWLAEYKLQLKLPPVELAEIIKIGNNVLARASNAGRYEQKLLSGEDPLSCWHGSNDCRIIWMNIQGHAEDVGEPEHAVIELYIEQQPLPNIAQAVSECARLQERFKTKWLFISFRSDDWFILDTDFPVIYPFIHDRRIPDLKAVKDAAEIVCVGPLNQNSFKCSSMRIR